MSTDLKWLLEVPILGTCVVLFQFQMIILQALLLSVIPSPPFTGLPSATESISSQMRDS